MALAVLMMSSVVGEKFVNLEVVKSNQVRIQIRVGALQNWRVNSE